MMPGPSALVLAAILTSSAPAAAGAPMDGPVLPSATGKVALEGALTANDLTPPVGSVVYVYFNVTSLVHVPALELRLQLSPALEPIAGDASLARSFDGAGPGRTVTLVCPIRVLKAGDQTVRASAQLVERRNLAQARPFLLTFNPSSEPASKAERGTNSKGEKLIIYEDSPPPTPPHHPLGAQP